MHLTLRRESIHLCVLLPFFPILICLCVFIMAAAAYSQDLGLIEGHSLEVRNLPPLACPSDPDSLPQADVAQYHDKLDKAVKYLREQLPKLQKQASASTVLGDASPSISKSIGPLVEALGNEKTDVCQAAAAFSKIKVGKVPQPPVTAILISPDSNVFDDLEVGNQSQPATFSITNKSSGPIQLNPAQILRCDDAGKCDKPSQEFAFSQGSSQVCPNYLDAAGNCVVQVIFTPGWSGKFNAQVRMTFVDPTGQPGVARVQLIGSAHVANVAGINGDGSGSNNPSMRSVVGFDISGASSAANQQKAFAEFDLNAPIGRAGKVCVDAHGRPHGQDGKSYANSLCDQDQKNYHYLPRRDPLERRLWAFFDPRITSLPQARSAISNLNVQGFSDFFNGQTTDLVQGLDVQGGLEYVLFKPRTGIPFFSSYKNAHARLGVALVAGAGFTTPFATPSATPTVFALPTGSPLITQFNVPAGFTNIAFIDRERSRFFRKYFAGIRLKTYQFTDLVKGACDPDYDRPCEGLYNLFPGIIDLTVGQDEQVTAGHLSHFVFRLDAVYPLPFASAFNLFGSINSAFQKNVSTNPLILPATSTTPLNDPSVFIVNVDPRNRDIYRIGLGVNLLELFKSKTPSPGSKVQAPPDNPPASKPGPPAL